MSSMRSGGIGLDILSVFDLDEDTRSFLAEVYDSHLPFAIDSRQIFEQSLLAGAEDWLLLVECARSLHRASRREPEGLGSNHVIDFVWRIRQRDGAAPDSSWEKTDHLIELARAEAHESDGLLTSKSAEACAIPAGHGPESWYKVRKSVQPEILTSQYWCQDPAEELIQGYTQRRRLSKSPLPTRNASQAAEPSPLFATPLKPSTDRTDTTTFSKLEKPSSHTSRFFPSEQKGTKPEKPPRPPAGTISCLPFPPLSAPRFGIVQELEAHDPFWLLIAVTFLIKTKGEAAVPVFRDLKERFPGPAQLVDEANAAEILNMIRHLGLGRNRLAFIQKYARAFLTRPPQAGVRYPVRTYGRKDLSKPKGVLARSEDAHDAGGEHEADPQGWEIGHITCGAYAIDSWRIFCRDVLLGRAEDYNGKGREPEFQPEWMRVLPGDKELRAFLRWMWMREGWEWNSSTGERMVLRPEMQKAVDEGRVEYDEIGGLRILPYPKE